MGLIGVAMGLISFFVRQTIETISDKKYELVDPYTWRWYEVPLDGRVRAGRRAAA